MDPGDEEDEDGRYNDDDVDDHLDFLLFLVQLDGGDEVDEEGSNDGQSTARKEDEPKDLQHLSVIQVVVDISLEAGGEANGRYKNRGDQDEDRDADDGEEAESLLGCDFVLNLDFFLQSSLLQTDVRLHSDWQHDGAAGGNLGEGFSFRLLLEQGEEGAVRDEDRHEQEETPFSGEENNQESSDNPRDEAREDVSQALDLLSNIRRLEGIMSSDHHRDGTPGEQDIRYEPTSFLWQTVSVAVAENLLLLPGNEE